MRRPTFQEGWPHQFKNVGQLRAGESWGISYQDKVCIHCHLFYTLGKDQVPQGDCPARTDKQELKRIHG